MTAQKHTELPFGQALKALMEAKQISTRKLARLTEIVSDTGSGLSYGYIGQLIRGVEKRPQPATIELLSQALKIDPVYFREYRLHRVAQAAQLKMEEVGLDQVLDAIHRAADAKESK